jgi:hypothetical protein
MNMLGVPKYTVNTAEVMKGTFQKAKANENQRKREVLPSERA